MNMEDKIKRIEIKIEDLEGDLFYLALDCQYCQEYDFCNNCSSHREMKRIGKEIHNLQQMIKN